MKLRSVKLFPNHDYVDSRAGNTPNVRSRGLIIAPPNNVFLVIPRLFAPIIRLYSAADTLIDPETRVYLAKKRPGDEAPTYAPGSFTLQAFYDLTRAEQRNEKNRSTLVQDLGRGIALREQEELHVEFDGPDTINWAITGTAFDFVAGWQAQ